MHFVSLCTLQATAGRGKELCSRPGWHCPSTVSPSDWCIWTSSWRCWFPPTALWRWPVPEWRAGCTTSSSVRSRWPGGITNYKDGRTGAMRRGWQWAGLKIRNRFSPVRPAAESCASCSICEAASLGYSSLTCLRGGEEVQSVSEVFSLCRFYLGVDSSFTWFLGRGGHAAGQRVRVDPSLAALLGAWAGVDVAPEVGGVHHRQTVQRRVLIVCSHTKTHSSTSGDEQKRARANCDFTLY